LRHFSGDIVKAACYVSIVVALMGDCAVIAVLNTVLQIFMRTAALAAEHVKRAIAEQAVEVVLVTTHVAWERLAFFVGEKCVFLAPPKFFVSTAHMSGPLAFKSKNNRARTW